MLHLFAGLVLLELTQGSFIVRCQGKGWYLLQVKNWSAVSLLYFEEKWCKNTGVIFLQRSVQGVKELMFACGATNGGVEKSNV